MRETEGVVVETRNGTDSKECSGKEGRREQIKNRERERERERLID